MDTDERPDLRRGGESKLDMKVIDGIADHERGQMLDYHQITKLRIGLILNFNNARLELEHFVL